MTTTVRTAVAADAELLHELARQTFPLACPPTTTPEAVAEFIAQHLSVELSKCYVLSDFHGAGIARALIDDGIARARAQGFAAMWLGVNQENVRANRFYEKMGFRLTGTKKFLVGERWEDDYVRELLLDAHA